MLTEGDAWQNEPRSRHFVSSEEWTLIIILPHRGTNRGCPAAESSPVADPLETGPPLSCELHNMASTAQVMGPACVAAQREPFVLPERVLNTMAEARAPTR